MDVNFGGEAREHQAEVEIGNRREEGGEDVEQEEEAAGTEDEASRRGIRPGKNLQYFHLMAVEAGL